MQTLKNYSFNIYMLNGLMAFAIKGLIDTTKKLIEITQNSFYAYERTKDNSSR